MSIKTKLHHMRDIIMSDRTINNGLPQLPTLDAMEAAHKYYIDRDVVDLMGRNDVQLSIAAMIQAGIARLPFDPLLIEYETLGKTNGAKEPIPIHCCVLLTERADCIGAQVMLLYDHPEGELVRCTRDNGYLSVRLIDSHPKPTIQVDSEGAGDTLDCEIAALGAMMALLMLNVRGIEKRVVEVAPLNKQRVKRGRTCIPSHTIIHIGTIYDRQGKGQRYTTDASGRKMRVHMRRGHARHQAFGEGHQEHKWIFIPPVLVNYREEGDRKIHPTEQVVRV
jgi:hypothetical protein